jgi:hypothetical protein
MSNVYQKLNEARSKLHSMKLEKSGVNKFAGYKYFELGDFLEPALKIFAEVGLCGVVRFGKDEATLTIVDSEKGADAFPIIITSPFVVPTMKGTNEIQALGAAQTYCRRYLWVAALEIVENDVIDAVGGKGIHKPTDGAMDSLEPADKEKAHRLANGIVDAWSSGDMEAAAQIWEAVTDQDTKVAAWGELKEWSKERAAFKTYLEQRKKDGKPA